METGILWLIPAWWALVARVVVKARCGPGRNLVKARSSNTRDIRHEWWYCWIVFVGRVVDWLVGFYPQLCHQLSELVNSSRLMSSSLSQCLTVFTQQDQVFVCDLFSFAHYVSRIWNRLFFWKMELLSAEKWPEHTCYLKTYLMSKWWVLDYCWWWFKWHKFPKK